MTRLRLLQDHHRALLGCRACKHMIGPVVSGQPVLSPVMMIGQAPGDKEGPAGKPFAWTAGKTLFKWFAQIGINEVDFRNRAYMAAVCRCFPGKAPKGGDRVPDPEEIATCSKHLVREMELVRPQLVLPIGKLAIAQVFPEIKTLSEIIGTSRRIPAWGHVADVIALPHPSGASTWHRTEPGISLLRTALDLVAAHPAWQAICAAR